MLRNEETLRREETTTVDDTLTTSVTITNNNNQNNVKKSLNDHSLMLVLLKECLENCRIIKRSCFVFVGYFK